MAGTTWWIQLGAGDVARGPHDEAKLVKWIKAGRITDVSRVSKDGATWVPAKVGLKHLFNSIAEERRREQERIQQEKLKTQAAAAERYQRISEAQRRAAEERESRAAAARRETERIRAEEAAAARVSAIQSSRTRRFATPSPVMVIGSTITFVSAIVVTLLGTLVFIEGCWGLGNLILNMATTTAQSPGEELGRSLGFAFAYPVIVAKICGGALMVMFACWAMTWLEVSRQQVRLLGS